LTRKFPYSSLPSVGQYWSHFLCKKENKDAISIFQVFDAKVIPEIGKSLKQ
jgi:uncharacterized ferritin-like protein (DUF455 family)